ncbi:uncharacterized protein BX663DRAFT_491740 [Cokeromyces recurvatus]|uniref:uncharacterized protein n=1 Tax=Cokeromyces recurvatus TaxID=90255 RepID=UPI00221F1008|nr:uncharacterized protein BX663DRAFT_491740 [Cokeromyces recurvatus]KAI7907691.1 hypothetical protein BX663DRAFT_491740 [Cokeromyces recurvatus]
MNKPEAVAPQPKKPNNLEEESSSSDDNDSDHEEELRRTMSQLQPPFLVRTKTREEKETMRQQFKKQEDQRKDGSIKSPYHFIGKIYTRFSTSFMLENKAATARDHLANERTFLAWLRTSLSLITVGVAITQLYHLTPTGDSNQVTHAKVGKSLGAAFVIFSIVFLYFANARYFHTQIAMTKGQFPASRGAVLFGSTCILAVLIAMFIVILLDLQ